MYLYNYVPMTHVPHFSGWLLCSVFFHVLRGNYAPIGVGQIIIIINGSVDIKNRQLSRVKTQVRSDQVLGLPFHGVHQNHGHL